jgi:hypothetical protein
MTFLVNFGIGYMLTWPLAVWVGRWAKSYQGGVPVVPYQRFVHDFPNVEPAALARKTFRWWFIGTCVAGGLLFANYTVSKDQQCDSWYTRPDLKPFPAMVPFEELDVTQKTALQAHYQSYRNKEYKEGKKTRAWYRLFFPNDANYSVKSNPYAHTHRENVYNPNNQYFAKVGTNHFRQHLNE